MAIVGLDVKKKFKNASVDLLEWQCVKHHTVPHIKAQLALIQFRFSKDSLSIEIHFNKLYNFGLKSKNIVIIGVDLAKF